MKSCDYGKSGCRALWDEHDDDDDDDDDDVVSDGSTCTHTHTHIHTHMHDSPGVYNKIQYIHDDYTVLDEKRVNQ